MTSPATLTLRLAMPEDVLDILHWRNETLTRSMSRDTEVIEELEHRKWFSKVLNDPKKLLLIGVCEEKKVGMVRFDRCNEKQWEINIIVNPEMRGKRLGHHLLAMALERLQDTYAPTSVLAVVHLKNEPSLRLFKALGFNRESDEGKFISLTLAQTSTPQP
jgi:RimJ/RimL family protein N-acetyltransferase